MVKSRIDYITRFTEPKTVSNCSGWKQIDSKWQIGRRFWLSNVWCDLCTFCTTVALQLATSHYLFFCATRHLILFRFSLLLILLAQLLVTSLLIPYLLHLQLIVWFVVNLINVLILHITSYWPAGGRQNPTFRHWATVLCITYSFICKTYRGLAVEAPAKFGSENNPIWALSTSMGPFIYLSMSLDV